MCHRQAIPLLSGCQSPPNPRRGCNVVRLPRGLFFSSSCQGHLILVEGARLCTLGMDYPSPARFGGVQSLPKVQACASSVGFIPVQQLTWVSNPHRRCKVVHPRWVMPSISSCQEQSILAGGAGLHALGGQSWPGEGQCLLNSPRGRRLVLPRQGLPLASKLWRRPIPAEGVGSCTLGRGCLASAGAEGA